MKYYYNKELYTETHKKKYDHEEINYYDDLMTYLLLF
jgi:hypothetical protein